MRAKPLNFVIIAVALSFKAAPLIAEEKQKLTVTDVTYIVEASKAGVGVKMTSDSAISLNELEEVAMLMCETYGPQVFAEISKRDDLILPTFVELDLKVNRKVGFLSFDTGQVRQVAFENGECKPL